MSTDLPALVAKIEKLSTVDKLAIAATLIPTRPDIAEQLVRLAHEELQLARLLPGRAQ
jgi:hypothetical protein